MNFDGAITRPPEVVTFDFWDTLMVADMSTARDARRRAMLAALLELGHDVTPDELERVFEVTVRVFNEAWAANRQFTATDGASHAVAALERDFAEHERALLIEAFVTASAEVPVDLAPGIVETLSALDDAGVRLGIICDVGMTPSPVLRSYLDGHGVLRHFDYWSFSDEVGVYKPDPVIFAHSLEGLGGVDPGRAAHVGDLRRTDVAGARGFGMTSIRYRGLNDDADPAAELPDVGEQPTPGRIEADVVIDDHAELPAILGLA